MNFAFRTIIDESL